MGIGRIERGTVHVGDAVALLPLDGSQKAEQSRVTKLFAYEGLDSRRRRTRIFCNPMPTELSAGLVRYNIRLEPGAAAEFELAIHCELDGAAVSNGNGSPGYREAMSMVATAFETTRAREP